MGSLDSRVLTIGARLFVCRQQFICLLGNIKLEIAKRLLLSSLPKAKVRSLMNFLRYYVRLENQQASDKFEQGIASITDRSTTMGIEQFLLERAKKEGAQKGIEQEKRLFVSRLLTKTNFTPEQIADMAGVSVAFVEQVKKTMPS